MASNSPRECPVCSEEYDEDERCPRVLPCSHSLCGDCIDKLIARNAKSCPFCLRHFQANSARNIGINTSLLDVLKILKEMELKAQDPCKGSVVSRSQRVQDLQRQMEELTNAISRRCQDKEKEIDDAIKDTNEIRNNLQQDRETLQNEVLIKISEMMSKYSKKEEYLGLQFKRLEDQKKKLKSYQEQSKKAMTKLEEVDTFKTAGPLIDEVEDINSETQNWLQSLNDTMSEEKTTRDRMKKVARNTKNRIKILTDVFSSPVEEDEDLDQAINTQVEKMKTSTRKCLVSSDDSEDDIRRWKTSTRECHFSSDDPEHDIRRQKRDPYRNVTHWEVQSENKGYMKFSTKAKKKKRGLKYANQNK